MNMWNAGVDGIYLFNFGYRTRPQFRVLFEIGDRERLAYLDKLYVPDARGKTWAGPGHWLKGGDDYYRRAQPLPQELSKESPKATVNILVGDDLSLPKAKGVEPAAALGLQFADISSITGFNVTLNGNPLKWQGGTFDANYLRYELISSWVKQGVNVVEMTYETDSDTKLVLTALRLSINYEYMGVPFEAVNGARYQADKE